MPEGHVIHRLAREFNSRLRGSELTVTSPQGRFAPEAAEITSHPLRLAEAHGKHLFIDVDAPTPRHIIHIHLGLIGTLRFEGESETRGQVRLHISDGATAANLRGPQWCRLISEVEQAEVIARLGADPIRADADPGPVRVRVQRSGRSIASLLMDQSLFAGVGNIYRAETLFRLGISPFLPGRGLRTAEFTSIWNDLAELMRAGVEAGRIDTVRPEHTPGAMGRAPRRDDHGGEVYAYRRQGLPCLICGTEIQQRAMEGRNLFWCPTCQG
ncbi:Fpg/Nei family DNA glycosylase [Corynebacterium pacaense]|uniref:Fpg/Nei family DNA glycosylase n=1 Tax=Corynebacterium pacaense TaxID=1816684 RepID=UPI0009BB1697|nr:DNA-formamidopyrimidine glycosylase family protein [Corynebacterium pacaense]